MGITIKEIARITGYGVGTVSRALSSDPKLIKDDTRKKIIAVAQKLGYVKDLTARSLVTGISSDIGLVIPAMFGSPYYNDFYLKVISGIMNAIDSTDYRLRVIFFRDKANFSMIAQECRSLKLGGLMLAPYIQEFMVEDKDLKKLDLNIVTLGKEVKGNNIRSVILDDFQGGYDGTAYLLDQGHEKIAVIRGQQQDIEDRYSGYCKALLDRGKEVNEHMMLVGDALEGSGYSLTMEFLRRKNKPTAIFCLDDEMAFGSIKAIKDKGLNCPGDISVLGYDGLDISCYIDPPLTTVARPVSQMAKAGVELILDKAKWNTCNSIKIKPVLKERSSVKTLA